jgi:hypothetical protein
MSHGKLSSVFEVIDPEVVQNRVHFEVKLQKRKFILGLIIPEEGSPKIILNITNYKPKDTAQRTTRF